MMEVKLTKIVGVANDKHWSQVHDFLPDGEKLASHGRLIAALEFKAKEENLEISSFGTEIITRLQEIYYSNESKGILKKLSQSAESLAAEFLTQVDLKIVMAIVWRFEGKTYLYAAKNGAGKAVIKRGVEVVSLFGDGHEGVEAVSGEIKTGDSLVVGTEQFFKIVGDEGLAQALTQAELSQAMESLAAVVHGHEHNSQAAAGLVKFEEQVLSEETGGQPEEEQSGEEPEQTVTEPEREEKEKDRETAVEKPVFKKKPGEKLRAVAGKIKDSLRFRSKAVFVDRAGQRKQKSAITLVLILALVFSISLFLAGRKRQKASQESSYQTLVEEVKYRYDEAQGLIELNPLRAKSLLIEGKEKIEAYKLESEKELSDELKDLLIQIEDGLGRVQREYKQDEAAEWFDFDLVKEGFKGSDWEVEDNELMVWDEAGKTAVVLNWETKASKVVAGGEKISGGELTGLAGERGFVVGKTQVAVIDVKEGEIAGEVAGDEWGRIVDAVGFSSNLYLLDATSQGQIWKYFGVTSGLSAKKSYLTGDSYDLSEAVSMAIDGSVWVLFTDGTIVKYTKGVKDAFSVAGLDEPFKGPEKIYADSETENIYVLDKQNTRVVVISKSGEYEAQYIWPGIAGVKDLAVSETLKKIFLLTGEKVFTIDLR